MMHEDLTGKLKVGDKVLQIFRQYGGEQLKQGRVSKLTKTRATISFKREEDTYTREYTLKTAELYPRSGDYSYTHIEPMTEANQARFDEYIERRRLEYSIHKSREVIDGGHHDLTKLTLNELRLLDRRFIETAELLKRIKK